MFVFAPTSLETPLVPERVIGVADVGRKQTGLRRFEDGSVVEDTAVAEGDAGGDDG